MSTNTSLRACRLLRRLSLVPVLGLCLFPEPAGACTPCVFAALDRAVPPVGLWCLLAVLGYLAAPTLCALRRTRVPGVPTLFRALLTALGALLLAAALLGPLALLPLALRPIALALGWGSGSGTAGPADSLSLRRLYAALSAVTVAVACLSLYTRLTRTEGEYIVRWGSTGPGAVALKRLQAREPRDLDQLRYIAEHGRGRVAEEAREQIADLPVRGGVPH